MAGLFESIGATIGSLGNMVITGIGNIIEGVEYEEVRKLMEDYLREVRGLSLEEAQKIAAQELPRSAFEAIKEDPRLRNYQLQALDELGSVVSAGGEMTAQDRLAYNKARQQAAVMANASRAAAMNEQRARGLGSGNAALVSNLMASQNANNMGAMMGMQAASDARQRYLQALDSLGSQSSNVRSQDYNVAANRASAQDAINRFNAQMRNDADKFNVGVTQMNNQNKLAKQGMIGAAMQNYANAKLGKGQQTSNAMTTFGGQFQTNSHMSGAMGDQIASAAAGGGGGGMMGGAGAAMGGAGGKDWMSIFGGGGMKR